MNHLKYEDKASCLHALVVLFFKTLYIKFACTKKTLHPKIDFETTSLRIHQKQETMCFILLDI